MRALIIFLLLLALISFISADDCPKSLENFMKRSKEVECKLIYNGGVECKLQGAFCTCNCIKNPYVNL